MKSNFFKYIFIIFVVVIVVFAIYMIYFKKEDNQNNIEENVVEETTEIKDLRLGISNYDTINPLISNNKEVLNIGKLIFEPLMNVTEDYKLEMCLATECSKTSDTTYVVKIDNNKKWHDGSPLIAKDIQFTIDRLKEGKSIYSYNVEKVISVEILDASTVKINLSEEVPFFEYNLTFPIMPNNYYLGEDFYESAKTPQGTGMYKISKIDSSYIVLEKNLKWWNIKNKDSKIEKIYIKQYSEVGELYNSFKIGNLDEVATDNDNVQEYIGSMGYTPKEVKGRNYTFLALNTSNELLSKIEVRKALAYSIDKENITSNIFNSKYYTTNFPLDYGNWLYQEEASSGYNLEQAKQVLVDAGWTYRSSSWQKTENRKTQVIELNLLVRASDSTKVATAQNIKEQLANQGIRINIVQAADQQYNNMINSKSYDIALCSMTMSLSPNLELFFGTILMKK